MPRNENDALYIGLSGIDVPDEIIELGHGILLSPTYAHLMTPYVMAFKRPEIGQPHPGPWRSVGGGGRDITAQLLIPAEYEPSAEGKTELASVLLSVFRVWTTPSAGIVAFSNHAFGGIPDVQGDVVLEAVHVGPFHFPLLLATGHVPRRMFDSVVEHWPAAHKLYRESKSFRLALDALSQAQSVSNTSLILVSLWAALEAIFSDAASEITFRISALLAAFLEPPGQARQRWKLSPSRRMAKAARNH